MVTLTLSSSLTRFLPDGDVAGTSKRFSCSLEASSWAGFASEMRERFQDLSAHVLDEDDQLRAGLLAAINDDVVSRADGTPEIGVDDRIYLFTQIAGG